MELLQLTYFLALAETEHVTKTAEKLMISQPTLSLTIRRLEEELGAELFDRNGRNIRLNENGRIFRSYAQNALHTLEAGVTDLRRRSDAVQHTISVGIQSPYVWQDLIGQFASQSQNYILSQRSVEDDAFEQALRNNSIDFYIGSLQDLSEGAQTDVFETFTFARGRLCIIVPAASPYAQRKSVKLAELSQESFICRPKAEVFQQYTNRLCEMAGFQPKVSMISDYTMREAMVAEGHGLSFSSTLATRWLNDSRIRAVDIEDDFAVRLQQLIWLKDKPLTKGAKTFLSFVQDYAQRVWQIKQ